MYVRPIWKIPYIYSIRKYIMNMLADVIPDVIPDEKKPLSPPTQFEEDEEELYEEEWGH